MNRLFIAAMFVLMPVSAFAEGECTSSTDCPEGFECVAPLCACAEGTDCGDCGTGYCVSMEDDGDDLDDIVLDGECDTDADCPMDFLCEEMQMGCAMACPECACAGCDPDNEDCSEAEPCECPACEPDPDCVEQTYKTCVYHPVECEQNSDCAENYECQTYTMGGGQGTCSACVCEPCEPDAEDCPPCDCGEPVCEEEEGPVEEFGVCVPMQKECAATDECPEGWTCETFEVQCACDGAMPACEGEGCEEYEPMPCECDNDVASTGYCVPGGWAPLVNGDATTSSGDGADFGGVIPVSKGGEEAALSEDSPTDENQNTGGGKNATDNGGSTTCSASSTGSSASLFVMLLALAALAVVRRRGTILN